MKEEILFPLLVNLLEQLIQTPSFSREEDKTATIIEQFLSLHGAVTFRSFNNVWSMSSAFDSRKPTLLLNSHHDTVKPNSAYTLDPFLPLQKDGKLFGLGSNDAGGALVALLGTFILLKDQELAYNLIFTATAEEEISGSNGIESILTSLPKIDVGIVGEPTGLKVAIAEKGLLVIDAYAEGVAGHAAHKKSQSAIHTAAYDIVRIQAHDFPNLGSVLGSVKTTVTQINAGFQHNVVPDECHFVIDARVTDDYTNQQVFEQLNALTSSRLVARSFRLNSSNILTNHPLVVAAIRLGLETYGSPTISDQALMPFPTIKLGPGESIRSHTADEFIYLDELKKGLTCYKLLIEKLSDETLG